MISRDEAERLRGRLLELLQEDPPNATRLTERLESLSRESGLDTHAALLLILTQLTFEEEEARHHWAEIERHRDELSTVLCRPVPVRVALLDYFVHVNRQLTRPTLIDLELLDARRVGESIDPLTGLADGRAFRRALQAELRRVRRYGQSAAVVLCDVDDLGELNERHGRLLADRLLREVAILAANNSRDIDVTARPGEDELAFLLPETDRNGALLVAERFRREVESFYRRREGKDGPVGLTISAGVAAYPQDARVPEELLERAAQALYRAKAGGKNVVQTYEQERRRFLRFDLTPGRFEVEVLAPPDAAPGTARDLSRSGLLFTSPARLEVGERIELRLAEPDGGAPLRLRGRVVRLEELPETLPASDASGAALLADRYDVGVAFELGEDDEGALLGFLERAQRADARAR